MTASAYRPCVGVMLFNDAGLVFIGRRRSRKLPAHVAAGREWQAPQGGIDQGETPFDAALRELREETNIASVALLGETPQWYSYDLPSGAKSWKGKFQGQTQKWFALRFTGSVDEIDIDRPGGGAHPPEFDAWRWEKLELLPELIVPFKRPVYELVVRDFAQFGARAE
ncbi:MAG: RNA pyrophosphohydrolase [Methylocystis sp.]|nr:RNA pyrophosphohydrolase [Methylocystis sp.]